MKKVLVTMPAGEIRDSFMPQHVCAYLEQFFDVTYNTADRHMTQEELKKALADCDAVMTGWGNAMLDRNVLEGNERLKLIVHVGGTVGNLIDSYAYEKGIRVFSGNQMYAESVAEGTIAYMLMGLRRIPDYIDSMRLGGWRSDIAVWDGLLDRTVGIVGMGTISSYLIKMLQCFRVKIKVYSHYPLDREWIEKYHCEQASLEEIFATCDVVSVHSALNVQNRGLIQKEHLELLKDGALFINTSRGDVIDEQALLEELAKKRFMAIVDVYHEEPPAQDSPFRHLPNVYPIPHMAGPTLDRRAWISKALTDEMRRFFDGEEHFELEITSDLAKRMTKM